MKTNGIVNITLFIHCLFIHFFWGPINCVWAHVFSGCNSECWHWKTDWHQLRSSCAATTFQALDSMILLLHCNFMISLKKKKVTALSNLTILWVISYIAGTLLRWPDENELISSRVSPQQGYRIPRTVISPSLLCRIWNFPRLCFYLLSFPIAFLSFRGLHSHSWISFHFTFTFPPHCSSHVCKTQSSSSLHTACVPFDPATIPLLSQSDI